MAAASGPARGPAPVAGRPLTGDASALRGCAPHRAAEPRSDHRRVTPGAQTQSRRSPSGPMHLRFVSGAGARIADHEGYGLGPCNSRREHEALHLQPLQHRVRSCRGHIHEEGGVQGGGGGGAGGRPWPSRRPPTLPRRSAQRVHHPRCASGAQGGGGRETVEGVRGARSPWRRRRCTCSACSHVLLLQAGGLGEPSIGWVQ